MTRRYLVALSNDAIVQFGAIPHVNTSSKETFAILDIARKEVSRSVIIIFLQAAYWSKALYFCEDLSWNTPKPADIVPNWDIGVMVRQVLGSSSSFSSASKDLFQQLL